jgi:3-oxoacyl-[acyl-carrier protein] reductase
MLWNLTDEEWSAVLDTNLKSQFFVMRAAVQEWMREHGGSIVNISSTAGLRGSIGQVNYAAAKAGVLGLTKSGALELGRFGVRVNAIAPGTIQTEMTAPILANTKLRAKLDSEIRLGRLGTVDDIAQAVAFLAGPDASWITGKVLTVDGGAYN